MTVERFLLGLRQMEQQGIEITTTAQGLLQPSHALGIMTGQFRELFRKDFLWAGALLTTETTDTEHKMNTTSTAGKVM